MKRASFPNTIKVMLMAAVISIGFTPESQQALHAWDGSGQRVGEELAGAFDQFITEVESFTKNEYFGKGKAINNRTSALVQAVQGEVDGPLSGFVGTTQGSTTPYARAILGPDTTTIRPKNAKHLWVPIADNLNPSGIAKHTPKSLFDTFGDRVKIFESKNNNTVVFVEDPKNEDGSKQRYTRSVFNRKDGAIKLKGQLKGELMFVLKDQVVIQGTDALAKGAQRMMPRGQELLNDAIARALPGGSTSGGGA